jgi:hypothetical protein
MGDPRQTAVSDLSKVIPWLVVPRFEHGTLWTRVKQRNHSAMAALYIYNLIGTFLSFYLEYWTV